MPDILDLTQPNELVETTVPETVVDGVPLLEVVEVSTPEIIVDTETTTEVIDATSQTTILETAEQGPPGPPGGEGETGPSMTYVAGTLVRVDYDSGHYKLFTYAGATLAQVDYVKGPVTFRNTFNYNPDGSLASVDRTVL